MGRSRRGTRVLVRSRGASVVARSARRIEVPAEAPAGSEAAPAFVKAAAEAERAIEAERALVEESLAHVRSNLPPHVVEPPFEVADLLPRAVQLRRQRIGAALRLLHPLPGGIDELRFFLVQPRQPVALLLGLAQVSGRAIQRLLLGM